MLLVPRLNGSVCAPALARFEDLGGLGAVAVECSANRGERRTYGGLSGYTHSDRADTCRFHRADIREGYVVAHIWRAVLEDTLEPNIE